NSVFSVATWPVSVVRVASTSAKRLSTDVEKVSRAVIRLFQSSARISSPALFPPNCSTNVISCLLSNLLFAEGEDRPTPRGPNLLQSAEHPVERGRVEQVARASLHEPDEHRERAPRLPREADPRRRGEREDGLVVLARLVE